MSNDRSALTSLEREKASVFHSWSAQSTINPLMIRDAKGVYVTGEDGTTYLDFSSQLVNTNIGHQHPSVVKAIQDQAGVLCTIAPQHGYESRYRAAELILDHSFEGASKVFFTNGGTEAVEHAVRMARLHTGRHKVLAAYRSYHGATSTSINLTGDPRRWPSDNGSAGWCTSSGRSSTVRRSTPSPSQRSAPGHWRASRTRSASRDPRRSPPSSSSRFPARPA